ncbi:MAG: acetolactate synthase large subunit [Acidiphilium sp. 37-64-53]|uniref:acetolactate synthase large subunit n=1 Tax=Acidiphilium TaxID=522 RepID=UPI000BC721E2|nr:MULTISPECIES: acetolactate synthase large subunit [Acidiphilium]OYW00055.1 MAG: acetolactate synthase large subunit [Acidiphilium sp. 37-64-53]HQT86245.1 acetolactate synthase large subunit [Acidiphilium rubrum]
MNGAESLVHTLIACGIDTVFANPGTSEMHFVAALDRIPGITCVLCLDETVASGAADAFWRVNRRPAATLLHCGPGLGNALANLHNARRGRSGIVNIVGDQATYHRPLDAPLTADTEGWARSISGFLRTATSAATVGRDAADAVAAAYTGTIATLILPADTAWTEGGVIGAPQPVGARPVPAAATIAALADVLRSGEPAMLLMGGRTLNDATLRAASAIVAGTGAKMLAEVFNARMERGQGRPPIERIPYPIDAAIASLAGIKHLILVEAKTPVGFFAYPGKPGPLAPGDCALHVLAPIDQDGSAAIAALQAELGVAPVEIAITPTPAPDTGAIAPEAVASSLAALLPADSVIIDEGISFGRGFSRFTHGAAPHTWMQVPGGAIGGGLPMAIGAGVALAGTGRRVIAIQADGSAMYSIAALWTAARRQLDITFVILANRKYAILLHEYAGVGANPGRTAMDMLDLGNPDLDFVKLAEGMGVAGAQAADMKALNTLLAASFERKGPFLIELLTI